MSLLSVLAVYERDGLQFPSAAGNGILPNAARELSR